MPSQRLGETSHKIEVLPRMAINSSEGIGKEAEAVGQPYMLGTILTVWSLMMVAVRLNVYG